MHGNRCFYVDFHYVEKSQSNYYLNLPLNIQKLNNKFHQFKFELNGYIEGKIL